jgi:DNA ligase D
VPSTPHGPPTTVDVDGVSVRLTSPDKPVFPGITKREVAEYYLAVGAVLVEQVGGRPTALERWPDGVREGVDHFFQKHLPKSVPPYVHGIPVQFPSGRPGTLLDPATRAAIAWAVQMGAITLHAWPVTAPEVSHPDQLRLDLDPSPANDFADVRRVAASCKEVLDELGLPSFVKTSGSRGLHVFVPIMPVHGFVDARHAAIAIGRELERRDPDGVTVSWWKEERGDRVFLDFNQNAQDRLMASAYSLRPRPSAPVSMPFGWDELADVDPDAFTLRTVPRIVASRANDPWASMRAAAADLAPALAWWDRDVANGLPELPYPPDFPKMPGEPPRVQPSRKRSDPGGDQ